MSQVKLKISLIIVLGCTSFLLDYEPLRAQQQIMGPSTHLTDIKSLLANPALISFQQPRFSTGIQAYHMGLINESGSPLNQGFATISTPDIWNSIGAGLNAQHFSSPIYRRSNFSLAASARLFRYVSIGGQISALNISYNSDNFELEVRDPVFEEGHGKTTLNSSIGLFAQPAYFLGLSAGIRNLNEPNISLIGDDVREPREFFAGFALVQGVFRSSFEIIKGRDDLDGMFFLEAFSSTTGDYVRAGSNYYFDQASIEGQLHVAGPLSVNYQYTLPLSTVLGPSRGSHMFSLIYKFGRNPKLPKRVSPPNTRITFEQPDILTVPKSRVYLSSESDTLKVYEKKISREIGPGVTDHALANVSLYDLDTLDSNFSSEDQSHPTEQVSPVPAQIEFLDSISPEYDRFLQNIDNEPGRRISIVSEPSHIRRAIGLHNRILRDGKTPADAVNVETPAFRSASDSLLYRTPVQRDQLVSTEETTTLQPKELKFNLYASHQTIAARNWRLTVRNSQDELVRTFTGTGDIPAKLKWDWLDESDQIIEPGIYTCQFSWLNKEGIYQLSNQRSLYVQKIQRNVTIHVTTDQPRVPEQSDQIRILIKQ
ncbi:MAG: hypothetical protein WD038_12260 [Balneolales bacterium]